MQQRYREILEKAYRHFNSRDIDAVLELLTDDVDWPNGWEGGYVHGHEAVRDYWTRQWKEIDPHVEPLSFNVLADERIETAVHQAVRDLKGQLLFDGKVKHIYTFEGDKVKKMEIQIVD